MTFLSIVKKNFKYNFSRYISFYFINSLIVGMLFVYGSLAFNNEVKNVVASNSANNNLMPTILNMSLLVLCIFSVVFITYTNLEFLKNRGKEFGMYLTLGMTRKDLSKLILFENIGILISSIITGIAGGMLLGRLFYMGFEKVLNIDSLKFEITSKGILLSICIFTIIFIGNLIFNMIYISRVSIITTLKSSVKGESSKGNLFMGAVASFLFVIALILIPKILNKEIFIDFKPAMNICIVITVIAPFFIIASGILGIKYIMSKTPKTYNNNLLILSGLSHKLNTHKSILYILSLLAAMATSFIGATYALYVTTEEGVRAENPFDVIFMENEKYNKVSSKEVESLLKSNNVKIDNYKTLEYLKLPILTKEIGGEGFNIEANVEVISESAFNKHMNSNIDIKEKGMNIIRVYTDDYKPQISDTIIPTIENIGEYIEYPNTYKKEQINEITKGNFIEIDGDKVSFEENIQYVNFLYNEAFQLGFGAIINDEDYNKLKENTPNSLVEKAHLINTKNNEKIKEILEPYLLEKNSFKSNAWESLVGNHHLSEDTQGERYIKGFKPVYTQELVDDTVISYGMIFYVVGFIGCLFFLANGVVLYYKTLNQVRDDKERVISLSRIGMTDNEIRKVLSKELAIMFFVPILVGGGLAIYYISLMFSNWSVSQSVDERLLYIIVGAIIIQSILYFISRRKFLKEILG